jgi:DNA-binding NtrC family response regulator
MRYNPPCVIGDRTMKKKILICDDEKGVRESLKLILSDEYDIILARNGKKAIDKIEHNPDLKGVVLDIKMPLSNGLELLRYIKTRDNHMPVIVVTGYQSIETAAESLKTGAVSYITKPFRSETVIKALKQAIP